MCACSRKTNTPCHIPTAFPRVTEVALYTTQHRQICQYRWEQNLTTATRFSTGIASLILFVFYVEKCIIQNFEITSKQCCCDMAVLLEELKWKENLSKTTSCWGSAETRGGLNSVGWLLYDEVTHDVRTMTARQFWNWTTPEASESRETENYLITESWTCAGHFLQWHFIELSFLEMKRTRNSLIPSVWQQNASLNL